MSVMKSNLKKPRINTAVISARADIRHLATVAKWLKDKQELHPQSRADLVYKAIEGLAVLIQATNGDEYNFQYTEQAQLYLERIGITGLNASGRNKKRKWQQMVEEGDEVEMMRLMEEGGGEVIDKDVRKAAQEAMKGLMKEGE